MRARAAAALSVAAAAGLASCGSTAPKNTTAAACVSVTGHVVWHGDTAEVGVGSATDVRDGAHVRVRVGTPLQVNLSLGRRDEHLARGFAWLPVRSSSPRILRAAQICRYVTTEPANPGPSSDFAFRAASDGRVILSAPLAPTWRELHGRHSPRAYTAYVTVYS